MATNGPNGNTPNGNINFNSNPNVEPGILGYVQGQNTKKQFTNDFWKEGGYLSESIKELEEMKRQYKEMSKEVSNLSKAEQKNFRERKQALNQQLALLKTIKENQEASDTEAIDAINSSNKLRLKGQQDLIKLLNSLIQSQDKADQEHLDNLDAAVEKYNQIKQSTDETGEKLKQTAKVLNKASDSWSDSLSKTLDKAGNKLSELSNMFNLQSIANNAAEQNARSKAAIMGDVSRQFGFTSNSQFESFKNSLNDTLKDMNSNMDNLFNAEDMKNYMANLSTYGITDPKMAEQQMKSSIIASKYLGVSVETQTEIFKYMKRTNNNDVLNKQNQTIVGLLKSDLGVSKEQLDALSQIAYGSAEDKAAIGMSTAAIDAQNTAMTTVGSVLSNMYGDSTADAIMQSINDFLLNPGDANWANIFGSQYHSIYNGLYSSTSEEQQVKAIVDYIKGISNSGIVGTASSGDGLSQALQSTQLNSISQLNSSVIASLSNFESRTDEFDKLLTDAVNSVKNTSSTDVDNYIEQTQEATYLEQIQNVLSTWINGLPWKSTMNLANLAFTAYLASGAVKLFGSIAKFIGGFANGGGLKGGLTALLGGSAGGGSTAVGAGMSSFLAGGIAVGLTTAAVAAISSAMTAARHENSEFYSNEWEEKLSNSNNPTDKAMSTNKAFTSALGQAEANKEGNWFSRDMDNLGTGLSLMWSKMTGANYVEKNKKFWDWLAASSISKKASTSEFTAYAMAYQFLLDEVGSLASWEGATQEDLKQYVKTGLVDKFNIKSYINSLVEAGWTPSDRYGNNATGNINWDKYAMNGVDWVPRDNYLINAHKGEMLLTADEAKAYRSMLMPKNAGDVREGFYSVDDGRRGGSYPYPITSAWNEARDGGRHHTGVDFGMSQGTPIGASIPGKVASASYNGGYGNLVVVQANDGKRILYAHQSKMAVKAGQQVNAGTLIGYVGSTGNSTGPHLHFEVRRTADYGTDIDPLPYVTNSLFNVGDTSGAVLSSSTDNFNNAQESDGSVQVKTRRFVPKAFTGNMGGEDNAGRIVNSVDGGFNKLISYLDSIRDEQAKQRALLNAFSKSRIPESTF